MLIANEDMKKTDLMNVFFVLLTLLLVVACKSAEHCNCG